MGALEHRLYNVVGVLTVLLSLSSQVCLVMALSFNDLGGTSLGEGFHCFAVRLQEVAVHSAVKQKYCMGESI